MFPNTARRSYLLLFLGFPMCLLCFSCPIGSWLFGGYLDCTGLLLETGKLFDGALSPG